MVFTKREGALETIWAESKSAQSAFKIVTEIQSYFVSKLEIQSQSAGYPATFEPIKWQRNQGRHGGGTRLVAPDNGFFNRGSVNVSQVHYEDAPEKALNSATALSTIIHPQNPYAPSIHMHLSLTELKGGQHYWRLMADLNPAIPHSPHTQAFRSALKKVSGQTFAEGEKNGEKYFYIPALGRHRGVAHFYLEHFSTSDPKADEAFALEFGKTMVDAYIEILADDFAKTKPDEAAKASQRAYHTAYFLQVLTLDRGTTSGLLIHDDNDVGTLGSLPRFVDLNLLHSYVTQHPAPQDELVTKLFQAVEAGGGEIGEEEKKALAQVIRGFYEEHPQAIDLQAKGQVIPDTVQNHSSSHLSAKL